MLINYPGGEVKIVIQNADLDQPNSSFMKVNLGWGIVDLKPTEFLEGLDAINKFIEIVGKKVECGTECKKITGTISHIRSEKDHYILVLKKFQIEGAISSILAKGNITISDIPSGAWVESTRYGNDLTWSQILERTVLEG